MQRDALERLNLRKMLFEPELLSQIEPDVHLVTTLLALNKVLPRRTRDTARQVVHEVVQALLAKLKNPAQQMLMGSLNRATRNRRPRYHEINWGRTILMNLKHYQPQYGTVVPERLAGYGRKRSALRHIILCVDQSGSMAASVVYASVYGAVLASLPAFKTDMVVFDTSVVDLTAHLHDPVELLFGTQLGGGTDIDRALGYCQGLVTRPQETILVLISDLYEGGNKEGMLQKTAALVAAGVQVIVLLALSDKGAPSFDRTLAAVLLALGVPSFACTPDLFPDLMAAAINGRDIKQWAATHDIVTAPSN